MSDRTDERAKDERTLRHMLTWLSDCDGLCDEAGETARLADRCWKALDRLLAADAAETQTLREEWTAMLRQRDRAIRDLQKEIDLRRQVSDQLSDYWRERDAAVADRDRLAEALRVIPATLHTTRDPEAAPGFWVRPHPRAAAYTTTVEAFVAAALAGREGSELPLAVEAKCDCRNRDGSASLVDIEGCPVHGAGVRQR